MLSLLSLAPLAYAFLPACEPPVVIDLRNRAAYESRHIVGSVSVPAATLGERMYELPPPREWPLTMVGSANDLAVARELLQPVWQYDERDVADPALWASEQTAAGPTDGAAPWRPNAFLASVVRAIEPEALPAGALCDVGCGRRVRCECCVHAQGVCRLVPKACHATRPGG